jgi:hypothetical protein
LPFLFWAELNKVFDVKNFIRWARPPSDVDLNGVETKLLQLANCVYRP